MIVASDLCWGLLQERLRSAPSDASRPASPKRHIRYPGTSSSTRHELTTSGPCSASTAPASRPAVPRTLSRASSVWRPHVEMRSAAGGHDNPSTPVNARCPLSGAASRSAARGRSLRRHLARSNGSAVRLPARSLGRPSGHELHVRRDRAPVAVRDRLELPELPCARPWHRPCPRQHMGFAMVDGGGRRDAYLLVRGERP